MEKETKTPEQEIRFEINALERQRKILLEALGVNNLLLSRKEKEFTDLLAMDEPYSGEPDGR